MCHISHWSRICDTQGLTILGKTHHCVCYWRCLVPSWCVLQCQWGLLLSPVFSSCSVLVDTDVTLILVMSQGTTTTEAGRDSSDQTRQHTTLDLRLAQHWLVDWTLNTIHYAYAAMIQIETLYYIWGVLLYSFIHKINNDTRENEN